MYIYFSFLFLYDPLTLSQTPNYGKWTPAKCLYILAVDDKTQPQSLLYFRKGWWKTVKVAVEFFSPDFSNELPPLQIVQILLLREDPRPPPPPMWCGLGGRQLRRPVRQVVLFNTSMNWSNHRVWCCFRFLFCFSPLMHGHLNKVVSRLISYMQRKVSPPAYTVTASFWCFC